MQTVLETTALQITLTYDRLKVQIAGLTHKDSLIQLPFRGNCLNWVVGHIVASRNNIYKMLTLPPFWTDDEAAAYLRGSDPITPTNAHLARPLPELLAAYDQSQQPLIERIGTLTEADLQKPWRENTVFYWLARYAFHEAYHVGQTEYLRQLAGKNDAV